MAGFADPFNGVGVDKITKDELFQAIRIDLASEMEAIFLYDAHSRATDDPLAKKVLADIRDEEKEHVGELTTLLRHLNPVEYDLYMEGEAEVKDMMVELGIVTNNISSGKDSGSSTVGSLKND